MYGQNGFDRFTGALSHRPSGRGITRATPQVRLESRWAHVVSVLIDIDELSRGTSLADSLDRRQERVRDRNDCVVGPHAGCDQRETKRVRAIANADAVFGSAVLRE